MTRYVWLSIVLVPLFWLASVPAEPTNGRIDQVIVRQPPPPPASGVTCTTTTANANLATVQSAVNSASNGDTICVAAGSVTWNGTLDIDLKQVNVIGASVWGGGTTTLASAKFFIGQDCTAAVNVSRIAGFTVNNSADRYTFEVVGARGWRIDHNTVTYSSAYDMMYALGCSGGRGVEGLFDHNTVTYGRIVYYGEPVGGTAGGNGLYAASLSWGTDRYIYAEDNTVTWPNGSSGGFLNHFDGNFGCRYVARFNTINNGRFEAHALQGPNSRGCRAWEIYGNAMTNVGGTPMLRNYLIRAGTGLIFDNTTDGLASGSQTIHLDNPRTHQDDVISQMGTWGACDTTVDSPQVDAHESGGEGYLCRDQIGSSTDASQWTFSGTAPTQAKQPAYIFHNTNTNISGEQTVELNCVGSAAQCTRQSTKHLVENRDWYQTSVSFTGTTGIGRGPRASRPATCTTGVAYWSTDGGGNWNTSNSNPQGIQRNGADGALDVCTATNTWTNDYYVPYTYPHPLQGGN